MLHMMEAKIGKKGTTAIHQYCTDEECCWNKTYNLTNRWESVECPLCIAKSEKGIPLKHFKKTESGSYIDENGIEYVEAGVNPQMDARVESIITKNK
jgi:hypothetical protein